MSEQQLTNDRLASTSDAHLTQTALARTEVYSDAATYLDKLRKDAAGQNGSTTQALPDLAIVGPAGQYAQTNHAGENASMEKIAQGQRTGDLLDFSVPDGKCDAYDAERFDARVIKELSGMSGQLASPQSLRDFHDRIAEVVTNWPNAGDFIRQAQATWPRVEQARAAYEQEVEKNFQRYGDNARLLLCRAAAPAEPAERAQALARTIEAEIKRAQTSAHPRDVDFPVCQAYQNWQRQIQDFALKSLGPA